MQDNILAVATDEQEPMEWEMRSCKPYTIRGSVIDVDHGAEDAHFSVWRKPFINEHGHRQHTPICTVAVLADDTETARANAHLIAAAPDLYEALEAARAFIADQYADARSQALDGEFLAKDAREPFRTICAALARARGQS